LHEHGALCYKITKRGIFMIVTTANCVDGKSVTQYLGIVTGAVVFSLPGGNKAVARGWQTGVSEVTEALISEAEKAGADAIIAVEYIPHGSTLCAVGTAVKF